MFCFCFFIIQIQTLNDVCLRDEIFLDDFLDVLDIDEVHIKFTFRYFVLVIDEFCFCFVFVIV